MSPKDKVALMTPPPGSILVIERALDAPREKVWEAWTTPDLIKRWWGPKGFTAPFARVSLRAGGSYLYAMRSPEGKDYWSTGFFHEIVPFERIVATDHFADEQGTVVPATFYGMSADYPVEMLVTVTFEAAGGKTKLTLKHAGIPAGQEMANARQGWNESLDKLAAVLAAG
jgi:uncharacterized protein YndB with AHSA1/START domain